MWNLISIFREKKNGAYGYISEIVRLKEVMYENMDGNTLRLEPVNISNLKQLGIELNAWFVIN